MACPHNNTTGHHQLCSGGFCDRCNYNPNSTASKERAEREKLKK